MQINAPRPNARSPRWFSPSPIPGCQCKWVREESASASDDDDDEIDGCRRDVGRCWPLGCICVHVYAASLEPLVSTINLVLLDPSLELYWSLTLNFYSGQSRLNLGFPLWMNSLLFTNNFFAIAIHCLILIHSKKACKHLKRAKITLAWFEKYLLSDLNFTLIFKNIND